MTKWGEPRDYAVMPEEDRVPYLVSKVYVWMSQVAIASGDPRFAFSIDPHTGLEALAFQAGGTFERLILGYRRRICDTETDKTLRNLGEVYLHTVYLAIMEMINCDMAEIVMVDRWPHIRLTNAVQLVGSEHADLLGDDAILERGRQVRERLEALRLMPYQDYLRTDEWREKRIQKIEEAQGRCQLCNQESNHLHVHHRTYENRGNERTVDLIALCPDCHQWFHESGRKVGR